MSASVPASPIVDALLAHATASLPTSYKVCDAEGPKAPGDDCPYVVLYADPGIAEGMPFSPNRELMMTFSWRAVGLTRDQSSRGGDRIRAAFDGVTLDVGGRSVHMWQTYANSVQRDDSLAPLVLFEHLILFQLRSVA